MGMVVVARLAARAARVPGGTITSTFSATSSAEPAASRSGLSSASRYSITRLRPSTSPRSRSPSRKASRFRGLTSRFGTVRLGGYHEFDEHRSLEGVAA
jgi:hypothetical protein